MFRIAFTVRDRHLADVLKSLEGKVFNMEAPVPVSDGARTTRRVPGAWLDNVPNTFTWAQAKQAIGSPAGGPSSYITHQIKAKKVKKLAKGRYAKV